jgi:peptidoglycan/LPS O-acetylase OafA/YrhL
VESPNTPYISRIDQLRFFAAALVVLYHSFHRYAPASASTEFPLLSLIDHGHTGVSIFMVLSGFIFTVISYNKHISYGKFILNRILRIYPLYLFVMMLELYLRRSQYNILSVLSFMLPFNHLGGGLTGLISPAMWTVAVEFQFYLIFPFLMIFLSRYGGRYLLGFVGLLLIARGLAYLQRGSVMDLSYGSIFGRLDQLIIGMAAGVVYRRNPQRFRNPLWLVLGATIALTYHQLFESFGGLSDFVNDRSAYWVFWPDAEGLSWAAFILPYLQCSISYGAWLEGTLAKLGKYSFSIYALHGLVLVGIGAIANPSFTASATYNGLIYGMVIILPATIALSALSYRIIEEPFLSMRVRYSGPTDQRQPASNVARAANL